MEEEGEKATPGRGCRPQEEGNLQQGQEDSSTGGSTVWEGLYIGRARSRRSQTSKQIQSILGEHRETYKRLAAGMT